MDLYHAIDHLKFPYKEIIVQHYEKNGYLLGDNLIVTHETSKAPLNIKVLDSYIKTYFIR